MAIFMTVLGKYSTHSHQWEGELCQGDEMQAIIYLGAQGWGCSHCAERAELVVPELHPSTTGLHILGLWRSAVNTGFVWGSVWSPCFMKSSYMCSVPGTGDIISSSGRVTGISKIKGDIWAPGEEVREFLTVLRGTHRPHQSSWPEEQQAQRMGRRK